MFGKNDREWFFASSIENREREVDIVANVGLIVEFLGAFTNIAGLADQCFCPFVVAGKERIFRMTHVWEQ